MPEKGHRYAAKVDLNKDAAEQPYLHVRLKFIHQGVQSTL